MHLSNLDYFFPKLKLMSECDLSVLFLIQIIWDDEKKKWVDLDAGEQVRLCVCVCVCVHVCMLFVFQF